MPKNQLHASASPLPRFFGLAKVHKPLVGRGQYTVKDGAEFVRILAEERISADEVMVSFDVKSLYTSLPVKRALSVVSIQLENGDQLQSRTPLTAGELSTLLEICLTPTYFTF